MARPRTVLIAVGCLVLCTAGTSQPVAPARHAAGVAAAKVTGPVTGGLRGRPETSADGGFALAHRGFVEQEFFVSGVATAYEPTTTILPDAAVPAPKAGDRSPYQTRLLVRRPADMRRFSGTVVVEWLNVTTQGDADPEWVGAYDKLFIPRGWAWVGVSAQRAGVEGYSPLANKNWDPVRYAGQHHPGDLYSYDIFTQAAKAVRGGKPLGGVRPKLVIGTGDSQSASLLNGYLSGYYKKSFHVFDGLAPSAATVAATRVSVPTVWINSMSEANSGLSKPDTPLLKVWEVAGASHADDHAVKEGVVGRYAYDETGESLAADAVNSTSTRDYQTRSAGNPCPVGRTNLFPYRYAMPVKYAMLERWLEHGAPPPVFPRLKRLPDHTLAYDIDGNAIGGYRLPVLTVPVATYSVDGCGALDGTSYRFTQARLRQLYPTHAGYVAKLRSATDRAVRAGLLFPADAGEILAVASSSAIPEVG
jgi:hypothetical protein